MPPDAPELQQRAFRLAFRITRNQQDAEDAQQEALLKVHRKLDQFQGRSRFTTWISRIAINEALMCLRKRRSAIYVPLEEAIQPPEESADLAQDSENHGEVGIFGDYFRLRPSEGSSMASTGALPPIRRQIE